MFAVSPSIEICLRPDLAATHLPFFIGTRPRNSEVGMARRVCGITGFAHDAKWGACRGDLARDDFDISKVSKVIAHAVVANQRDEVSTSVRRVVATAPPFIDCVDLCDRSTGWGDDERFAAKDIDRRIIVVIGPVTDIAHRKRKDIGRDWDCGRC